MLTRTWDGDRLRSPPLIWDSIWPRGSPGTPACPSGRPDHPPELEDEEDALGRVPLITLL
eukprot:2259318-Pyramimonas_sp.AAC.1